MPAGKDKESGLSPEIARLSALLARDPNSKLFMPLAEEYIKAGMVEEAAMTLEEGLKANPYYMSARVLLGKAYMEKSDLDGARGQFEQVVKAVPDNLLAHRKLGEIYRAQGNRENAIRSYKMITLLSPKDEEARRCLTELESGTLSAPPAPPEPKEAEIESHRAPEPAPEEPVAPAQAPESGGLPAFDLSGYDEPEAPEAYGEAESPVEVVFDEPQPSPAPGVFETPDAEPLEAGIFGPEEDAADVEAAEEAAEDGPPVYTIEDDVLADEPGLDWLKQAQPEETAAGPVPGGGTKKSGYALDLSQTEGLEDIFGAYGTPEKNEEPQAPEGVYEINDISGTGLSIESIRNAAPSFEDEPQPEAAGILDAEFEQVPETAKEGKDPFETETLAELYIAQGFYDRAISIYKNLLLLEPQNRQLRQKIEELYQLEKLNAARPSGAAAPEAGPEIREAEPEPLEAETAGLEQDDGAGIIWGAETEGETASEPFTFDESGAFGQVSGFEGFQAEAAEDMPRSGLPPAVEQKNYDPAAVSRLERLLENIRRKVKR